MLVDSKADLLVYGNAERQIGAIAQRLHAGATVSEITDLRGTAFVRRAVPADWVEIDSTELDTPGPLAPPVDPYASEDERKQVLADRAPTVDTGRLVGEPPATRTGSAAGESSVPPLAPLRLLRRRPWCRRPTS